MSIGRPLTDVLPQDSRLEIKNKWDTSKQVPVFYFQKQPIRSHVSDLLYYLDKPKSGWALD